MKVLVLLGSDSMEREVSLKSGKAVIDALSKTEHEVSSYDPSDGEEGLFAAIEATDVVLPIIHGQYGEDGTIQRILDRMGKKYLGAGVTACEDSFSKTKAHEILAKADIAMPRYEVVTKDSFIASDLAQKPYVLKPIDAGSSLDTVIVRTPTSADIDRSVELFDRHEEMLLEELIDGTEVTVGIVGDEVLPPILIIPPQDGEFDYENKYNGKTQEICPIPEDKVSAKQQEELKTLATRVHQALGVRHLSRTDMIIREDGHVVVLELNTIPGLTNQSLIPNSAAVAGMDMVALVEKLIQLATEEHADHTD